MFNCPFLTSPSSTKHSFLLPLIVVMAWVTLFPTSSLLPSISPTSQEWQLKSWPGVLQTQHGGITLCWKWWNQMLAKSHIVVQGPREALWKPHIIMCFAMFLDISSVPCLNAQSVGKKCPKLKLGLFWHKMHGAWTKIFKIYELKKKQVGTCEKHTKSAGHDVKPLWTAGTCAVTWLRVFERIDCWTQ